jgi:lysophospholipase L1-like esterase
MTRRRPLAVILCAIAAALALAGGADAAEPGPYVALGDSYTAAPLVLNQVGRPVGCMRSDRDYPAIVRAAIGATYFQDESCSAATTAHMTAPQPVPLGIHAPQFTALSEADRLVTIGIGGNDVGLFGVVLTCLTRGLLTPTGDSCRRSFATLGGDSIVDKIAATAPRIAATLQGIHARAPHARVLIVGYPAVAPPSGRGCHPLVPLSGNDIVYLDEMMRRTNAMIAAQAAANDAEYVDTYGDTIGHDVCTGPRTRWFEGLIPARLAAPLHPNADGAQSMARSVLRVLAQSPPSPWMSALTGSAPTIATGRGLRLAYTLRRPTSVTFGLQRSRGGGRYTPVRDVLTVDAAAGANAVTLPAGMLGRRPGLYRVTAAPAEGEARSVQVRIRRLR